jgi:hypothetical protein
MVPTKTNVNAPLIASSEADKPYNKTIEFLLVLNHEKMKHIEAS